MAKFEGVSCDTCGVNTKNIYDSVGWIHIAPSSSAELHITRHFGRDKKDGIANTIFEKHAELHWCSMECLYEWLNFNLESEKKWPKARNGWRSKRKSNRKENHDLRRRDRGQLRRG